MSIRESRLCDHAGCNDPATGACELCKRDACPAHLGRRYLTVAVMEGTIGDNSSAPECLGKCVAIQICSTCHDGLYPHTTGLNKTMTDAPLHSMMQPLRDQLIEAAGAFLAEKNLKKK